MKTLKVSKFQWYETIKAVRIYYAIFLIIITWLAVINLNLEGSMSSSGLEFSSVIFCFVAGLNSFKSNFKFSQANNISRKTFFKGLIVGIFPITLMMSVLDLIINRIYNIFVHCPTNFDMIYGSFRDTGMRDLVSGNFAWTQANDIFTLMGTVIWQFAAYSIFFLLGIMISMIYYRSNKFLKVIVSVVPVLLIIIFNNLSHMMSILFWSSLGQFISAAFGWQNRNPYAAVLSFGVLGAIFGGFIYLLMRRAVAKE